MKEYFVWKPGLSNPVIWSGTQKDVQLWIKMGYEVEEVR